MNINELNKIKEVNIEKLLEDVKEGSGTFKQILDDVYNENIIPLVANDGLIVGISYKTDCEDSLEDNVAKAKFELAYRGIPVQDWALKALQLKATSKVVKEVIENETEIKVILDNDEEVVIESYQDYHHSSYDEELPETVIVDVDELDGDVTEKNIKNYLRNRYDHYLSGNGCDLKVEVDEEIKQATISNISWGRKR